MIDLKLAILFPAQTGEVYYPEPCELCKCVVEKSSICYRIKCDETIACPDGKEAYLPEGECCKKCPISVNPGDVVEGAQVSLFTDVQTKRSDIHLSYNSSMNQTM